MPLAKAYWCDQRWGGATRRTGCRYRLLTLTLANLEPSVLSLMPAPTLVTAAWCSGLEYASVSVEKYSIWGQTISTDYHDRLLSPRTNKYYAHFALLR